MDFVILIPQFAGEESQIVSGSFVLPLEKMARDVSLRST
jgi:hypothetical protein